MKYKINEWLYICMIMCKWFEWAWDPKWDSLGLLTPNRIIGCSCSTIKELESHCRAEHGAWPLVGILKTVQCVAWYKSQSQHSTLFWPTTRSNTFVQRLQKRFKSAQKAHRFYFLCSSGLSQNKSENTVGSRDFVSVLKATQLTTGPGSPRSPRAPLVPGPPFRSTRRTIRGARSPRADGQSQAVCADVQTPTQLTAHSLRHRTHIEQPNWEVQVKSLFRSLN